MQSRTKLTSSVDMALESNQEDENLRSSMNDNNSVLETINGSNADTNQRCISMRPVRKSNLELEGMNKDEQMANVEHEPDIECAYDSLVVGDVICFMYDAKIYNGIVVTVFEDNKKVIRIAIKHLDKGQEGAVYVYNIQRPEMKPIDDAIENMWLFQNLMPTTPRGMNQLREKMFVTFNGSWGNEYLGGWIKKLDYSSYPGRLLITLDPLVIGEMDEQGTIDMEMENSEGDVESPYERLLGGGIKVFFDIISGVFETIIPHPQVIAYENWVDHGDVEEIGWKGPIPGFKQGKQIPPYRSGLSKDEQCEYDIQFLKQH